MLHESTKATSIVAATARGTFRYARVLMRAVCFAAAVIAAGAVPSIAEASDPYPVYRFYNTQTGTHFYTISAAERDIVLQKYAQFVYEGAAFWAYTQQDAGTQPIFRFYNNKTGTHFYTIDAAERDKVIYTYPQFIFEGAVYYAMPAGSPMSGAMPLFRFYNNKTGAHFYTTDTVERDHVINTWPWFAYEGSVYMVATGSTVTPPPNGNVPPKALLTASATAISAPGSVTLTATATDQDGTVSKVSFYEGATLLVDVMAAPYIFTFNATAAATLNFTAVAVDNQGALGTSNAVTVTAGTPPPPPGPNVPPKVSLVVSPTVVTVPGSVTLTATATDQDGTVGRVSFYQNGTKVIDLMAPTSGPSTYAYTVSLATPGTYLFTAEAADNSGAIVQTAPQPVSGMPQPPVVTASADAFRLLNQATFGPTPTELARVISMGVTAWVDDQLNNKPTTLYPDTKYNIIQLAQTVACGQKDAAGVNYPANAPQLICYRDHLTPTGLQRDFFTNAMTAPDQLRQRVAWAMSQIHVIATTGPQDLTIAYPMSRYQNILTQNAFGNFQNQLNQITLSPAMGNWLTAVNNDRASGARVPNENYAREIMQLFSIGLVELGQDGQPLLDAQGQEIPTYDQNTIKEFAKVFTGYTYANAAATQPAAKQPAFYVGPMMTYPVTANAGHETAAKSLLNGFVTTALAAAPTPAQIDADIKAAVNNVFMHPNTGPYISKQLIQFLVTANPSPAYVSRITAVFNNNGVGTRGDMKAVVRAILLDPVARGTGPADPTFGALKEPVLMVTSLLRGLTSVTDGASLTTVTGALGQRPYSAPTVFNYFPPDFTIPNTSVLGPVFALHNTSTAISRANQVYSLVYNGIAIDPTVPGATGTVVNTAQFDALAVNPAALVDQVDTVLLGGSTPAAAKALVVTAVNAIPAAPANARSQMAVYLMASSYHFQVQH